MPDILGELERDWDHAAGTLRHLMHPHGAPQPAVTQPQPVIPHNGTQEATPMTLLAEIEGHAKAIVAKFEAIDHEALDVLDRVQGNPATAEGLQILAQWTHLPPESLAVPLGMLRGALQALGGQAPASISGDAQPAPAGPQVGGQA